MKTNDKKAWEDKFWKIIETCSTKELEDFFDNSEYQDFSNAYKQTVMNELVCLGYKNETLAKWALTTSTQEIKGDIHENADRPLRLAAKYNVNFAKYLLTSPDLKEKANINETNDGSSALLEAIETKNLAFIKYLITSSELDTKALLDIGTKKAFDDPLCKACSTGYLETIQYLLSDECYPNKQSLTPKSNLAKFSYASIYTLISQNNVEALTFIIDNKLLDIKSKLHDFFCNAVRCDSIHMVNYLESFFEKKPDLKTMRIDEHSLLYDIARSCHYSRIQNHSYLALMLDDAMDILSPEEIKSCENFYIYNDVTGNVPFKTFLNRSAQRKQLENELPVNNVKKARPKL